MTQHIAEIWQPDPSLTHPESAPPSGPVDPWSVLLLFGHWQHDHGRLPRLQPTIRRILPGDIDGQTEQVTAVRFISSGGGLKASGNPVIDDALPAQVEIPGRVHQPVLTNMLYMPKDPLIRREQEFRRSRLVSPNPGTSSSKRGVAGCSASLQVKKPTLIADPV